MHKKLILIVGLTTLLSGCAMAGMSKEQRMEKKIEKMAAMDFPETTTWINVELKTPPHTAPRIMYVDYYPMKIEACPELHDAHQQVKVTVDFLREEADGKVFGKKVAMLGGGICEWTVGSISLGLEYASIEHLNLGEGYKIAPGRSIKVEFNDREYLAYDEKQEIDFRPDYYVRYEDTESRGWNLGGDFSGKLVTFLSLHTVKEFLINKKTMSDPFNINFAPRLDESKRAFLKSRIISKPGDKIKEDFGTTYYIDGKEVKKTNKTPSFDYLNDPEYYIFGDESYHF